MIDLGYEDLTPEQIMTIAYLAWTGILIYVVGYLIGRYLIYRTSRFIYLKIEKEIVKNINQELISRSKPFYVRIVNWFKERRKKKQEENAFIKSYGIEPIEKVKLR